MSRVFLLGLSWGLVLGIFGAFTVFFWGVSLTEVGECIGYSDCIANAGRFEGPTGAIDRAPGDWIKDWIDRKDTAAEWLMALFTTLAFIVLLLTLRATQRMARDNNRFGEQQLRLSRAAAYQAVQVGKTSERQLKLSHKPWVAVSLEGPFVVPQPNAHQLRMLEDDEEHRAVFVQAKVCIENVGDVPAHIFGFDIQMMQGDPPHLSGPA